MRTYAQCLKQWHSSTSLCFYVSSERVSPSYLPDSHLIILQDSKQTSFLFEGLALSNPHRSPPQRWHMCLLWTTINPEQVSLPWHFTACSNCHNLLFVRFFCVISFFKTSGSPWWTPQGYVPSSVPGVQNFVEVICWKNESKNEYTFEHDCN